MYIKITTDSTCDLPRALTERYDITVVPLTINMGGAAYLDGLEITPDDIYRHVGGGGSITTTSATNPADYAAVFEKYAKDYDAVIHINLGSDFSSCYQNARLAASGFSNVFVVDSKNLSTGHGHLVLEAAIMAQGTFTAEEIVGRLSRLVPRVSTSFVLERLDYMRKGGRCSAVAALGANLLKLKPCIAVREGKMGVVQKYRGTHQGKILQEYVKNQLEGRNDIITKRIFITHSGIAPETVELVRQEIKKYQNFQEILETRAGCTVSSHCGPGCLGILFLTK